MPNLERERERKKFKKRKFISIRYSLAVERTKELFCDSSQQQAQDTESFMLHFNIPSVEVALILFINTTKRERERARAVLWRSDVKYSQHRANINQPQHEQEQHFYIHSHMCVCVCVSAADVYIKFRLFVRKNGEKAGRGEREREMKRICV
jgi:hypothetical protein